MQKFAQAAESIAESDILSKSIRSGGNWSLLPHFAFSSTIVPADLVCVSMGFPKFPEWLGKNSSQRKSYRELRELRMIMGHAITGSRFSVKFDYAEPLLRVIRDLLKKGQEKIPDVIRLMDE